MDFSIYGGPGTNPLHIPRDDCSLVLGDLTAMLGFSTALGQVGVAPTSRVVQGLTVFVFNAAESPVFRIKLVLNDYLSKEFINTCVRPNYSRLDVPSLLSVRIIELDLKPILLSLSLGLDLTLERRILKQQETQQAFTLLTIFFTLRFVSLLPYHLKMAGQIFTKFGSNIWDDLT